MEGDVLDAEQVVAVGEALRYSEADRGFSLCDSLYQHHFHNPFTLTTPIHPSSFLRIPSKYQDHHRRPNQEDEDGDVPQIFNFFNTHH